LFGGAATSKPGGLFGQSSGGGLFGKPASGGLFQAKPLGFVNQSTAKKEEEDDDDDDVVENDGEKSPPTYVSDHSKVAFKGQGVNIKKSPYTKLIEKAIDELKIVKPSYIQHSFENFNLSIEHAETNGKKVYLLVLRSITKIIFQGTITASSKVRAVTDEINKHQVKIAVFH